MSIETTKLKTRYFYFKSFVYLIGGDTSWNQLLKRFNEFLEIQNPP